jgi:hypothetical protein
MTYLLILAATIIAAVAGGWLLRAQKVGQQRVCRFRCRSCGQKLRYPEGQEGRKVLCPQCLRPCTIARDGPEGPPLDMRPAGSYRLRRL